MKWKNAALVFGLFVTACQMQPTTTSNTANKANTSSAETDTARKAPTDLQQLAQRIVTQSAGVKEGEIVMISGSVRDMELMENLDTEVRKVGGEPILTITSDRIVPIRTFRRSSIHNRTNSGWPLQARSMWLSA